LKNARNRCAAAIWTLGRFENPFSGEKAMTMRPKIDLDALQYQLAGHARGVAIALLGEPNWGLSSHKELRFGNKGSTAVVIAGPKAGSWYSHELNQGGNMIGLIMDRRNVGFGAAVEYAEVFIGSAPREVVRGPREVITHKPATEAGRNRKLALGLWDAAAPTAGTLAATYLASRGFDALPPGADGISLRFHPDCPYKGRRVPAMLALLRSIDGDEPMAVQRTALAADGTKIGRRTLGPKDGAAVKLSPDEAVGEKLTIGEGVESALAGIMLGHAPCWAVHDAGELKTFPVLPGINQLMILVDNDEPGNAAANACSATWRAAGRKVLRHRPKRAGEDANDIWLWQREQRKQA
jgi:putative DNA primase/helicase